ncbi:hypothetical protein CEXT_79251 [Caerostris extrusa]|uniref:Uncharacterized protein n=1 Tax=Caerostris extrusa TaxID=172846 RepID=A0AAV4WCE9_CAEEX|nr:hypothetical protein CEXT_79251 [Caerostris extrusa]
MVFFRQISYAVACTVKRLEKTCGESARRALVTIIERLHYLSNLGCTEKIALDLRDFFESLTFDTEEEKRLYQSVFEMLAGGLLNV